MTEKKITAKISIRFIVIFLILLFAVFVIIQYFDVQEKASSLHVIENGEFTVFSASNSFNDYCIRETFNRCVFAAFALIIVCFIILPSIAKRQHLEISNGRIVGRSSLSNKIDDTVNEITNVKLRLLMRAITVTTASGEITLWAIENRQEIYDSIKNSMKHSSGELQN